MKKLCIVCLVVFLAMSALGAAPVREEAKATTENVPQVIDLSGYEDGTLIDLMKQVQAEIAARHIEATAQLRKGTYVFGQDIPVGTYVLTKSMADQNGGMIELLAANDDEKLYDYAMNNEPFEAYIIAEDGDVLKVEFPCDLKISAGVSFQ